MTDAMIECEGLTKRFGTFTAVDHVSFSVARGSIFGFLGPNGSGKSTVIRMLCGILEPTEGTARIAGHDIANEGDAIKEMIGYMSQKFSLYDELTVNENLIFSGKLYSLPDKQLKQRRDELIAITHLEPYLDRRAALLSGGWRQRLAMACALMHKPTVLVSRRTDRGHRSRRPARALGFALRIRRAGDDAFRHHALHGRGRALLARRLHLHGETDRLRRAGRFETNAGSQPAGHAAPGCDLRSRHGRVARDAGGGGRVERHGLRAIDASARG